MLRLSLYKMVLDVKINCKRRKRTSEIIEFGYLDDWISARDKRGSCVRGYGISYGGGVVRGRDRL